MSIIKQLDGIKENLPAVADLLEDEATEPKSAVDVIRKIAKKVN
ncbi:hypothetical protein [Domibacillus aminovorans]|nr:hypothetical protein [Domibacillus aminovorans]